MGLRRGRLTGRLIAGFAVVGILLGVAPQPAFAAVTVKAQVDASIVISPSSCAEFLFVYTRADFSPQAVATEVRVTFAGAGAPAGLADSHSYPGGVTEDEFDWNSSTSELIPGVKLTVKADWSGHNGNGLGRGYASDTTTVTVPLPLPARKLDGPTKCALEKLSRLDARYARDERAAARAVSA